MSKVKAKFQKWNNGNFVHDYIDFDRQKALLAGESDAVARYDHVLSCFMKLSETDRKKGIIYAGVDFDFLLEEVE